MNISFIFRLLFVSLFVVFGAGWADAPVSSIPFRSPAAVPGTGCAHCDSWQGLDGMFTAEWYNECSEIPAEGCVGCPSNPQGSPDCNLHETNWDDPCTRACGATDNDLFLALNNAIVAGDRATMMRILSENGKVVSYDAARRAVQLTSSCSGVYASIPVVAALFRETSLNR